MTRKSLFIITLFTLLLIVHPAAAHGYIIRSIPQDRAVLERAPTRLQYWFSESLEPQFSAINLRNPSGDIIASGGVDAENSSLLSLRVPGDLADGAYIVELRPAFASDGHVVIASRVFFVGAEIGGIQGQEADDTARPLEVIWKALLFHATYLMFGAAAVYAYILVPVWGSTHYPQSLLPPRVMRRLNWMLGSGLGLAVFANIAALLQQSMIFFNASLATVIEGNLWQVVRVGSRFGDVWHFRMFMLLVIGVLYGAGLYFGRTYPKVVRSFWTANVWALALLIGAQAVNSHAAGSLILPWIAVIVHWLHTLAVAFWVGGISALTLILPVALEPYTADARWAALRPVMLRFSRYIVGIVLVVITTGLYSATNWFYTPADLATTYGAALGYKVLLVALLLFVGALHHIALRPHLLERLPMRQLAQWAQRFNLSLRLEVLFVMLTMTLSALLSATPIPQPDFLTREVETPSAIQQVGDYTVQVSLAPGGTGINTLDTLVERNGVSVDDISVYLQFVAPEVPLRSRWLTAESVGQGLYVVASDSISTIGNWQTLVEMVDAEGNLIRAAFTWDISTSANVIDSQPPSAQTWLMLMSVIVAVGYVLYPAARALTRKMQWTRVNIVVSGGLILMLIIMGWFSIEALNRQQAAIERQQNPTPQIVNTVLPDMDSLRQGEQLFHEQCLGWLQSADLGNLVNRLDFMRDDDLFAITENGWRNLPPCDTALNTTERWHIANYIRSRRQR